MVEIGDAFIGPDMREKMSRLFQILRRICSVEFISTLVQYHDGRG